MSETFDREAIQKAVDNIQFWMGKTKLDESKKEMAAFLAHYDAMAEALKNAIEGWEDCACYKSSYLVEKHGDLEGIKEARNVLSAYASQKEAGE